MTITTQQARLRFTTIPSRLQDAMFSIQTDEIMDGIAQQYHLDDIKNNTVAKIAGWVLLGFIHPGDVAQEIQQQLSIPSQVAADISKSLDNKFFTSLKDDLAKAYAPALTVEEEKTAGPTIIQDLKAPTAPAPIGPKIISEGFTAKPNAGVIASIPKIPAAANPPAAPQPKPMQDVISQTATGLKVNATALGGNRSAMPGAAAPTMGVPATKTTDVKPAANNGWSRQTPQDPVVKLGVITPNAAIPKPAMGGAGISTGSSPTNANAPAKPIAAPISKGMSEFERMDMMKKMGQTPSAPASPSIPPPPMMLHQMSPTAVPTMPNFQINANAKNEMNSVATPKAIPPKPAVLEFGGVPTSNANPATGAPKVVHYSEYKTTVPAPSVPPVPPASAGPRHITEITPQNPPAATVPQPQPQEKVIVQDFLGPQK